MPVRGARIPFLGKPPVTAGGEDRLVKLLPVQEEVSNGRMGLLGQWMSRPGYETRINLEDATTDVTLLVRHQGVVAATKDGRVYRAKGEDFSEAYELEGRLNGHLRPMATIHDGALVVADGGDLMVVEAHQVRRAGIPSMTPTTAPAVEARPGWGEVQEGSWVYALTMTTVAGESLIGPESAVVEHPVGRNTTRVYFPDMSDEDRRWVLSWSVYRRKAEGLAWGYVGTANLGVAYIDDTAEAATESPPTTDGSSSTPPKASACCVVGDYLVLFGHDSTGIRWSNPGSHDYFPPQNTTDVQLDGGYVQTARGNGKDLLVFRTTTVDLYALVGSTETFIRRAPIRRGCLAKESVVLVNDETPYWLGNDGIFYRLKGLTPDPIGALERDFVLGLKSPESLRGEHFPLENVIRWFGDVDGVCIGYNYAKDHFFRDFSWDGKKRTQLGIKSVLHYEGTNTTFVGLSAGRVGVWGDDHWTDMGGRIRTIRRFTVQIAADSRQARVNDVVLRHQRGAYDVTSLWQGLQTWTFNTEYSVGDRRVSGLDPIFGTPVPYICHTAYTSGGMTIQQPGNASGLWEANWRRLRPDDLYEVVVRWGFDQGPKQSERRFAIGDPGDTKPFVKTGPCGYGREIWIELERAANVPVSFTGGYVVAAPMGDGL